MYISNQKVQGGRVKHLYNSLIYIQVYEIYKSIQVLINIKGKSNFTSFDQNIALCINISLIVLISVLSYKTLLLIKLHGFLFCRFNFTKKQKKITSYNYIYNMLFSTLLIAYIALSLRKLKITLFSVKLTCDPLPPIPARICRSSSNQGIFKINKEKQKYLGMNQQFIGKQQQQKFGYYKSVNGEFLSETDENASLLNIILL